ncbi:hypothetical protein P7L87_24250 [Vibrio parahaemolyticus]|nr:hypothetical protein [Vibrio parahaemolyticus]
MSKPVLNPQRRDNVRSVSIAAAVGLALLVFPVVDAPKHVYGGLVAALFATLLAVAIRHRDGFWQLLMGFTGALAATIGTVFAAFPLTPGSSPDFAAAGSGLVLAVLSGILVVKALPVVQARDAEARLMEYRNANELANGWLSHDELAQRRTENHTFWKRLRGQ